MTEPHTAACFLRVDIGVSGDPSPEAYHALSERLQDLLQEALLQPHDGGAEMDLQSMTCLVLGPIPEAETINETLEYPDYFAPVAQWLSTARTDD